ncbi:ABC transporter ATP-binding protein [Haloarchaeobius salinus]|uniref:ABC transporter ATP-binding protein n=1 Tax=Haloarchaeobius salinus TaxID=1198298 RepID=UPI00210ACD22
MTTLAVEDLEVRYGQITALRDVDLTVSDDEMVAVVGPNGAGKSTLANTVSGFLPYSGRISYREADIAGLSTQELVQRGLIHCTESRDLFGYLSVEDNLTLGAYAKSDARAGLDAVYDLFPRLEERRNQPARTMSGGEQQMLAIGRALMGDPSLLVLDEPTLGLAPVVLDDISDGLDRIRDDGVSVLLCEQNVTFALQHADRVYLLENGQIQRDGDPDLLRDDEYVREVYLGT